MNEKLELKDIACYLPYAMKGIIEDDIYVEDIIDSVGEDFSYTIKSGEVFILGATMESSFQPESIFIRGDADGYVAFENIKPILRPMTCLVKPLPDGTIPIAEMWSINLFGYNSDKKPIPSEFMCEWTLSDLMENISFDNYSRLFEYLYAHHFDINNLISRGLAIDINTIQQ